MYPAPHDIQNSRMTFEEEQAKYNVSKDKIASKQSREEENSKANRLGNSDSKSSSGHMESSPLTNRPLPQGPADDHAQIRGHQGKLQATELNPQPLPPGPPDEIADIRGNRGNELNPQPLPPAPEMQLKAKSAQLSKANRARSRFM